MDLAEESSSKTLQKIGRKTRNELKSRSQLFDIVTEKYKKLYDETFVKESDFVVTYLILLMYEKDFYPIIKDLSEQENIEENIDRIFPDIYLQWKSNEKTYEIYFKIMYHVFSHVKLVVIDMAGSLLINIILLELNHEVFSACLSIDHINTTSFKPSTSKEMLLFDQLSMDMQDKIVTPARSRILNANGYPSASLVGIPPNLIMNILLNLKIADIVNIFSCCHTLNSIGKDDMFWKSLVRRDFNTGRVDSSKSWHETYKTFYQIEVHKEIRRQRHGIPQYISYCLTNLCSR